MLYDPRFKLELRGEVLKRDALPTLLPAWEDLCRRSIEDNVYYSPRYARALLESVERDKNIGFAVVWKEKSLVAMLPFTRIKLRIPLLQPAGHAWRSKYTYSCMPLLDRLTKAEATAVLLEVLAGVSDGEWIIPTLNVKGDTCKSLIAALEQRGSRWAFLGQFQRATLAAGSTFDEHMMHHVSSKRRRDLVRNRRRLEEMGKVEHESYYGGEGLDRAVSAFLAIEAKGWKGMHGTALACDEKTRKFAINAFTGDEHDSICRADVLKLEGVPIAVSITTLAGGTGFTVKCCYDEAYRRFSAGLLLETEVIRSFLEQKWASRLDAATNGTHIIDSLWPGRIEVADLIFSLSPRYSELRLCAFRMAEQTKRSISAATKRWFIRLRQCGLVPGLHTSVSAK